MEVSGEMLRKSRLLAPIFGVIAILTLPGCSSSLASTASGSVPGEEHGPSGTEVSLNGLDSTPPLRTGNNGLTRSTVRLSDKGGKVVLNIARGTRLLDSQGNALRLVSCTANASTSPLPPAMAAVASYRLGPEGARCLPGARLTLEYGPSGLPGETREDRLFIALWDGRQSQGLVSIVDMERNTVSARSVDSPISHCSRQPARTHTNGQQPPGR